MRGVRIYNDNNATTPDATLAALKALREVGSKNTKLRKRIILIMGGTDKGLDMSKLMAEIKKCCKGLILLKETGTSKFLTLIHDSKFMIPKMVEGETLKECVTEAMNVAQRGDSILFSPAFASFARGFKIKTARGGQFGKLVSSEK